MNSEVEHLRNTLRRRQRSQAQAGRFFGFRPVTDDARRLFVRGLTYYRGATLVEESLMKRHDEKWLEDMPASSYSTPIHCLLLRRVLKEMTGRRWEVSMVPREMKGHHGFHVAAPTSRLTDEVMGPEDAQALEKLFGILLPENPRKLYLFPDELQGVFEQLGWGASKVKKEVARLHSLAGQPEMLPKPVYQERRSRSFI